MDNWDEIRTAFQVARMGTVSGAAEVLGVHHATVIRHIDALEGRLGVKLFQRHARGYTATEAGQDLLQVAQATDDQFSQLIGRIKGQGEGVSGELVVTSIAMMAPLIAPTLARFRDKHPDLTIRFLTGARLFRLEYGEAHVAIRAGASPDQPDNVVQPFGRQAMALAASRRYIDTYGMPGGVETLQDHWFIGHDEETTKAPFNGWIAEMVPTERIKFRVTDNISMLDAVRAGAGIGFVPQWMAEEDENLQVVVDSQEKWGAPLWLVTHVDLHRTTKVQAFLSHLKEEAKDWPLK